MEYLHGLSDHALAYRVSQVPGNLTAFKWAYAVGTDGAWQRTPVYGLQLPTRCRPCI